MARHVPEHVPLYKLSWPRSAVSAHQPNCQGAIPRNLAPATSYKLRHSSSECEERYISVIAITEAAFDAYRTQTSTVPQKPCLIKILKTFISCSLRLRQRLHRWIM